MGDEADAAEDAYLRGREFTDRRTPEGPDAADYEAVLQTVGELRRHLALMPIPDPSGRASSGLDLFGQALTAIEGFVKTQRVRIRGSREARFDELLREAAGRELQAAVPTKSVDAIRLMQQLAPCELHEVAGCAICHPPTPPKVSPATVTSIRPKFRTTDDPPVVPAEFESTCPSCEFEIFPGDMITLSDGVWVHQGCE